MLTALAWLVPHETAAVFAQILCMPYNHAPCHFMQSHIRKVYACLAVTCHLHFWQNDQDLLHATAVTHGWNDYRNKSQHRKLTLEKKILLLLLQGFKPATFQAWVWRSNHWAIPAPLEYIAIQSKLLYYHQNRQAKAELDRQHYLGHRGYRTGWNQPQGVFDALGQILVPETSIVSLW